MFFKRLRKIIIVIIIFFSVILIMNTVEAVDTLFEGNVYEFDTSFKNRKPLNGVKVIVKTSNGSVIMPDIITEKKGYYDFTTASYNDPLTIIYSMKGYDPYPKRIIKNDLKEKTLESVALVKSKAPEKYNAIEVVYLSQAVVDVMLIRQPDDQLKSLAKYLSSQLEKVTDDVRMQAFKTDTSTFYNIHRLMPTNEWLQKTNSLSKYLELFE